MQSLVMISELEIANVSLIWIMFLRDFFHNLQKAVIHNLCFIKESKMFVFIVPEMRIMKGIDKTCNLENWGI